MNNFHHLNTYGTNLVIQMISKQVKINKTNPEWMYRHVQTTFLTQMTAQQKLWCFEFSVDQQNNPEHKQKQSAEAANS